MTRNWVYLGMIALAVSGLYSVALVVLRTPLFSHLAENKELFRTALVVHVDLSVLVWLLSINSAIWCSTIAEKYNYWLRYSFYVSLLGVLLISISPLTGDINPVLNNYIPMLENVCFISGIVLFGCGLSVTALLTLFHKSDTIVFYANVSSALSFLISSSCIVLSYFALYKLQYPLDLHFFYETLFWSGGHALQFVYVSGFMIIGLVIFQRWIGKTLKNNSLYNMVFILNLILLLPVYVPHIIYKIDSVEFTLFYSEHMKYCGGVAPLLLVVIVMLDFIAPNTASPWKDNTNNTNVLPAKNCLISSICLFAIGGIIGLMISGTNVTIPAHYHGSIVGISLAFMGYVYIQLNSDKMLWSRAARIQPYIYSIGQVMHIVGLACSGGYGVMRKNPGAILPIKAKLWMGIMGLGGAIAIIGGLMFVYICGRRVLLSMNDTQIDKVINK